MDATRDAAWQLLTEYTKSESLLKHALAVEAAEEHPFRGSEILREKGYPEWVIRAILSHADYSGVSRDSLLEKTLFACDEMAGFINGRLAHSAEQERS